MTRAAVTTAAAAFIAIGGVVGCKNNKTTADARNNSVTDISAPAAAPASAYQPTPSPVMASPTPVAQPAGFDTTTPSGVSSGSYTVKKGDTLYSIARQRYGDGKQWTKIASANPGVRPETLKVGQSIVVP